MTIKYLASYSGPSYGSMDQEFMDGMEGLHGAMQSMRNRQNGKDWTDTYREDPDGVYHAYGDGDTFDFPATTRDDVLWVYYAIPFEDGYTLGDLAYCITVGPRGGIRSEKA